MWLSERFDDTLVTQLLARNTSVRLSVTMLASKCFDDYFLNTRCHSSAAAVPNERLLLSSVKNGRAGIATSLPVPKHQPKAEKQALSSVSVPAPTQRRRKSHAQGSQVIKNARDTRLFGGPRGLRAKLPQILRGASLATSQCGLPRQGRSISNSRWQMASLRVLL